MPGAPSGQALVGVRTSEGSGGPGDCGMKNYTIDIELYKTGILVRRDVSVRRGPEPTSPGITRHRDLAAAAVPNPGQERMVA